jgi:hypothetical protein
MTVARLIVEDPTSSDSDDEDSRREVGVFDFVELPSINEVIGVQYDGDFNYLMVLRVVHFPIPHPFEPDPAWPSLQAKEPSVHVITKWVGIG